MLETSTGRILQLETENKRLIKQLSSLRDQNNEKNTSKTSKTGKTTTVQHIMNGISGKAETTSVDIDDLATENNQLKLDIRKLQTRLTAAQTASENLSALETRASLLDLENKRLMRKAESFQQTVDKVDVLERENGRLITELEQAATRVKEWSREAAELKTEKEDLERSVESAVDTTRLDRLRVTQLEDELSTLHRRLSEINEPEQRSDTASDEMTCNRAASSTESHSDRCVDDRR